MHILTRAGRIRGIILQFASGKNKTFLSINQTDGKPKEQNINVVEVKLNPYEAVALFPKFRSSKFS